MTEKVLQDLQAKRKSLYEMWEIAGESTQGDIWIQIQIIEGKIEKLEGASLPEDIHVFLFVLTGLKSHILTDLHTDLCSEYPENRNGELFYFHSEVFLTENENNLADKIYNTFEIFL